MAVETIRDLGELVRWWGGHELDVPKVTSAFGPLGGQPADCFRPCQKPRLDWRALEIEAFEDRLAAVWLELAAPVHLEWSDVLTEFGPASVGADVLDGWSSPRRFVFRLRRGPSFTGGALNLDVAPPEPGVTWTAGEPAHARVHGFMLRRKPLG